MPGSQCCSLVGREFQKKHFWFHDLHPGRFCYSQWRLPLGVTLLYRFLLAAYCCFWLIITSKVATINTLNFSISVFAFLTTWTYIVLTVYLVLHFLCCLIMACNSSSLLWRRLTSENHRRMFHELQVQPSLWDGNEEYESVPGNSDENQVAILSINSPTILMKIVWMFYNIASLGCLMVTIIFWTMLYPQLTISGKELLYNFQLHAVTSIIIIIEHAVSAIPIRVPHFVYTILYGLSYLVFSGILYAADHRYVLYPHVLDWSQPGPTAVVVGVTVFVALPLMQLFFFGLYHLRLMIFNKCNPEEL